MVVTIKSCFDWVILANSKSHISVSKVNRPICKSYLIVINVSPIDDSIHAVAPPYTSPCRGHPLKGLQLQRAHIVKMCLIFLFTKHGLLRGGRQFIHRLCYNIGK